VKNIVLTLVAMICASSFMEGQVLAGKDNPRKELAKVTQQFVSEAKSTGYRFKVRSAGGVSDSENHVINRNVIGVRSSGYSLNHLMYLPNFDAYIATDKGAIEHKGNWRSIYTNPKGRYLKSMITLPEELLLESLRKNSKVEWVEEGRVLKVELHKGRSNRMFTDINQLSTMDRLLYYKYDRKKRTISSKTEGVIQVEIDPTTQHVEKISLELLAACKDQYGRVPKRGYEYSEGTDHVVYRLEYDIEVGDTVVPVEPMILSKELKKLLK